MTLLYRCRATLQGWQGAPGLLTTYHRCPAPPTLAGAQAASDRVRGALDVVKTLFPSSWNATMQAAVDVIDDSDGSLDATFGTTPLAVVSGTLAGTFGPPQVMAGLSLATGVVVDGKRLRGRINLGPLHTSFTQSLTPPAGVITAVNAFGVALLTAAPPAASAPLMVWHRPKKDPVTGAIVRLGSSSEALSSQTAQKWFTLRSRLN